MSNVLNKAKTMRNLKLTTSAGICYFTAGRRLLEIRLPSDGSLCTDLDLKPGATFYCDSGDALVTIQGGSGGSYITDQPFAASVSGGVWFYYSQDNSDRGRNSSGTVDSSSIIAGMLIPDAVHYIYASPLDDAGNPDYYVYVDTLQPERGVHPYTRDISIGSFKTVPRTVTTGKNTGRPIMDLPTRIRNLEGVFRTGRSAGSSAQDDRLAKLVTRLANLETWANSTGHFGTPPAVGSTTTYLEDDFIQAGDPTS